MKEYIESTHIDFDETYIQSSSHKFISAFSDIL